MLQHAGIPPGVYVLTAVQSVAQAVQEQGMKCFAARKADIRPSMDGLNYLRCGMGKQQPSFSNGSSVNLRWQPADNLERQGHWQSGSRMMAGAMMFGLTAFSMRKTPLVRCVGEEVYEVENYGNGGASSSSSSVGPARWAAVIYFISILIISYHIIAFDIIYHLVSCNSNVVSFLPYTVFNIH